MIVWGYVRWVLDFFGVCSLLILIVLGIEQLRGKVSLEITKHDEKK